MIHHFSKLGVVIILLFLANFTQAQEEIRFQVAEVDTSQFPIVRITLVTADSRSAPADLSGLTLQENGIAVNDITFDNVPQGIDATFVIDANTGIEEIDDESGLSRREKILASIARFTAQYMNGDGLDRISIIVPGEDRQSGQFLVQNESDPQQIAAALETYQPLRPGPTPLNAMLNLALEHHQQNVDRPRYQSILLFSDARRLDEQLSYPLLVAIANDINVPIYGAILGLEADEIELDNMARLTEATQAFHVHMPQEEEADPIYQIWQQQGNPVQLSYRSRQRQSGRNQVTLSLDSVQAAAEFQVVLSSPEVDFSLPNVQIERVGTGPDTPLESLQPQIQPVEITLTWPDEIPRQLIEVLLLANNRPQRVPDELIAEAGSQFEVPWDISALGAGDVELVVQVIDELGYQGQSEPQRVTIEVKRPLPPTAVVVQEDEETGQDDNAVDTLTRPTVTFLAVSGILLLLFGGVSWIWRKRGDVQEKAIAGLDDKEREASEEAVTDIPMIPVLQSISPGLDAEFILEGSNITFGGDAQSARVVLEDESIGRLHARIRRQDDSFWLFDEGSASGVALNYERLGLAPQELHDGDIVQFGNLSFRFLLKFDPDIKQRADNLSAEEVEK